MGAHRVESSSERCSVAGRYSQLTVAFGRLLSEKRLGEEELGGLQEDKLRSIRSFAKFLAEDTAA